MEKTEQFYQQVTESIKLVFDLTSRIDERVKNLVEQQGETEGKIDKIMDRQETAFTRIAVLENKNGNSLKEDIAEMKKTVHSLEIKLASLEFQSGTHENKWKLAGDFIFKLIIAAVGAIMAWKLSSH